MLKELKLTNFRAFDEEVTLRVRPITVLIGRNSAGKSSIIKFLLMLQQSLGTNAGDFLVSDGSRVRLGEFSHLRNSHRRLLALRFKLCFETLDLPDQAQRAAIDALKRVRPFVDPFTEESRFEFTVPGPDHESEVQAAIPAEVLVEGRVSYSRAGQFGIHRAIVQQGQTRLHEELGSLRNVDVRLLRFPSRSNQLEDTLRRVLADRYLEPIRYEIESFRHLEPVREESTRVIIAASPPPNDVGQRGQFAMPHLQRLLDSHNQNYNHQQASFVREHLTNIAGVSDVQFSSGNRGYVAHAKAVNQSTGAESYLADFGFGVGQCLPIIVQGALTPKNHLLIVEQPEAQLHPSAQIEMGSFFAKLWTERQVYSLIETHSSQIILRLRRLIAKGELRAEDVSIAYLHANDTGTPRIKNLDLDANGNLEKGLPMEFFGADIIESMKMGLKQ